jgi:hypothetical protein
MKITDSAFPLDELRQLVSDTADPRETKAANLAIALGGRLTARDDQEGVGNIVFIQPGHRDDMYITFLPLTGGGNVTTICVTLDEIIEVMTSTEHEKAS